MVDNAMVPVPEVPGHMARLNITFNGQNGDLPDHVSYDSTDADIKQMATEAVRSGAVRGVVANDNPDFAGFVVERFPAHPEIPYNRILVRPKTEFGV
jgi:hypothetical protein